MLRRVASIWGNIGKGIVNIKDRTMGGQSMPELLTSCKELGYLKDSIYSETVSIQSANHPD